MTKPIIVMAKLAKTLKDAYLSYPNRISAKDPFYVSNVDFRAICLAANRVIMDRCMEGESFHMPHFLGEIRIKKVKIPISLQKRKINYKLTKEFRKAIYHSNNHSEQYYAKWFWDKGKCKVPNKTAYKFRGTRKNNRLLAKNIIVNNTINNYLS
jgi:hypothetical protein